MKNAVESLLEDDHQSLSNLLTELDREMANSNIPRAFELLDLFWARLAVHIRAENLHLFPALANVSATSNRLEEEQVYAWPSLLFDNQMVARLCESLRQELENLPPRFG